jgi:hypothetical protein
MRCVLFASMVMGVSISAASAADWKEYEYSRYGFAVSFPAAPIVDNLPYQAADGTTANAMRYSVRDGSEIFSIDVVDLSSATITEADAIDQAIDLLRENGDVRLNIPARVNRHFGRQLSVVGKDGRHSTVAIFFADNRLYQIQGTILADSADPNSGDAIRFQQSLRFTGDNFGQRFGPGFAGRFRGQPGAGFRGGRGFGFRRNPSTPQPDQAPAPQPAQNGGP